MFTEIKGIRSPASDAFLDAKVIQKWLILNLFF